MFDPRIETAFRNAAITLRDSNGQPPTEERIEIMLAKFKRLSTNGKADDVNYLEAIGGGWK